MMREMDGVQGRASDIGDRGEKIMGGIDFIVSFSSPQPLCFLGSPCIAVRIMIFHSCF